MHFLRSLIGNTMADDGFRVLRLIRTPNPEYKGNLNNKYIEKLVAKPPLTVGDIVKLTDTKGLYALGFTDCLYVLYDKKSAGKTNSKPTDKSTAAPEYLNDPLSTTIIFDAPYAVFDRNGIVINPRSLIFEGTWGRSLMAELLPVDYVEGE